MPAKDLKIKQAIEQVIGYSRKGRVKVTRLVQKKNPELGSSRIRRVYEQQGFSLTKKLKRRMKNNPANPITVPLYKNIEWGMDFMSDALTDGRKIRTLNIIDHCNRQCMGITIAHSLPARRVIEFINQAIEQHGKPKSIRTDNGPEFTSKKFQAWLFENKIDWSKIQKGKPQQNAIVERFNRTYREDVLDSNWLHSLKHAQQITDEWITEYNTTRPHESLQHKTPLEHVAA